VSGIIDDEMRRMTAARMNPVRSEGYGMKLRVPVGSTLVVGDLDGEEACVATYICGECSCTHLFIMLDCGTQLSIAFSVEAAEQLARQLNSPPTPYIPT
jgi:hypothetical protein